MIDHDDIDHAQAAIIDRRIGQAFAFARVAVQDPAVLEEFAESVELGIREGGPNSQIPETAFVVTGTTPLGEPVSIAMGGCVCNATRDRGEGKFWLRTGEQRVCSACRRVYSFDGERITVTERADAMIG
ncbi:MAG: hypothetical protein H0T18_05940 [Chloroflexia bacterium]|nr:hypothetical protein [Chloroflexia bacterium]